MCNSYCTYTISKNGRGPWVRDQTYIWIIVLNIHIRNSSGSLSQVETNSHQTHSFVSFILTFERLSPSSVTQNCVVKQTAQNIGNYLPHSTDTWGTSSLMFVKSP
jgi:hypothetical protein